MWGGGGSGVKEHPAKPSDIFTRFNWSNYLKKNQEWENVLETSEKIRGSSKKDDQSRGNIKGAKKH